MPVNPAADALERGKQAAANDDWKTAAELWLQAAMAGNREAATLLPGTLPGLRRLADTDDADAQALAAGILMEHSDESALPEAFALARSAVRTGHPAATRTLGFMYRTGREWNAATFRRRPCSPLRPRPAIRTRPSTWRGMHITGDIRYRSHAECIRLLRQAAEAGPKQAATALGDQLSAIDEDAEALQWYVRAAEAGHVGAMFATGCWFRDGIGTDPDPVQAVRWLLAMFGYGDGDGVHEAIRMAKASMADEQIRAAGVAAGRPELAETLILTVRRGDSGIAT